MGKTSAWINIQSPGSIRRIRSPLGCSGRNTLNMGKYGYISHWLPLPPSRQRDSIWKIIPGVEICTCNSSVGWAEFYLTYAMYGLAPWKSSDCSFLCTPAPKDVDYNFVFLWQTVQREVRLRTLQPASGQTALAVLRRAKHKKMAKGMRWGRHSYGKWKPVCAQEKLTRQVQNPAEI